MKLKELCFARMGLAILIGGFALNGNLSPSEARGQVSVSVGLDIRSPADFDAPLTPYGAWVEVGQYGRCWHPAQVAVGWRPYTVGHWEWTDAGWYWMSDDPWAWACYHYGQWVMDPQYGWVWVPGTEWAPAWVVWRDSPDYIGWAPCGPGGVVVADTGFVFVDAHHFHDRFSPRSFIFNDRSILQRTRLVRNFRREDRDFGGVHRTIFANPGPGLDPIQRATGTRFTQRPVVDLVRETRVPDATRRSLTEHNSERSRENGQQPATPPTGRDQQRLYREAPQTRPAPTGRDEQRLYREVPNPQPNHRQTPPKEPNQVPRRQPVPEVPAQPSVPRERTLPPPAAERGRSESEVPRKAEPAPRREEAAPRREEPAPRVAPAPAPRQSQPPAAAPGKEKERERDGQ